MRVFVTGASGHIGFAVVVELLGAGHTVAALARSDASADKLEQADAEVVRGDLDDVAGLVAAAKRPTASSTSGTNTTLRSAGHPTGS